MKPIAKPELGLGLPSPATVSGNTVAGVLVERLEQRDGYIERRRDRRD